MQASSQRVGFAALPTGRWRAPLCSSFSRLYLIPALLRIRTGVLLSDSPHRMRCSRVKQQAAQHGSAATGSIGPSAYTISRYCMVATSPGRSSWKERFSSVCNSVSPSKLRTIPHRFWGESLGRLWQNGQGTRGAQVPRHHTGERCPGNDGRHAA